MCMKRVTVREKAIVFVRYSVIHKLTALMMAAGNGNLKSLKLIKVTTLVKTERRKGSTFV